MIQDVESLSISEASDVKEIVDTIDNLLASSKKLQGELNIYKT